MKIYTKIFMILGAFFIGLSAQDTIKLEDKIARGANFVKEFLSAGLAAQAERQSTKGLVSAIITAVKNEFAHQNTGQSVAHHIPDDISKKNDKTNVSAQQPHPSIFDSIISHPGKIIWLTSSVAIIIGVTWYVYVQSCADEAGQDDN